MDYEHSSHNGDLDHGAYLPNPFHKNSGLNNLIQILSKHSSCFWWISKRHKSHRFSMFCETVPTIPSDYQSYVVPLGSMVLDPVGTHGANSPWFIMTMWGRGIPWYPWFPSFPNILSQTQTSYGLCSENIRVHIPISWVMNPPVLGACRCRSRAHRL